MKHTNVLLGIFFGGFIILGALASLVAADTPSSDSKITHQVHSAIVADESLPYCAHRVNVDAKDGQVTLKGQVHTEEDKAQVEQKAKAVVGTKSVVSQIVVKE